jgi:ferredoxin
MANSLSPQPTTSSPVPARPTDGSPAELRVWIDQDLCTGDGICTDHAPAVFAILEDGIAYCLEGPKVFNDPGGAAELARVPRSMEEDVIAAAAECPGECIFIEFAELPDD